MITKNVKDAIRSLRRCNNCLNVLQLQMNELLNDIDDHLTTFTNILNTPLDYCDECGELYPDDCVCEEDDYMDDDDDDYDENCEHCKLVSFIKHYCPPSKMNAFARARILNENH